VIVLHGEGGTAHTVRVDTGWAVKADKAGFLAAFPEGTPPDLSAPARFSGNPQTWNDGSGRFPTGEQQIDDVAFLNAVMDDVIARFSVDPRRIFVAGFSNGASMALRLGVELPSRIAAVAAVSGTLWLKNSDLTHPVSLLVMVGDTDAWLPLDGGKVRLPWGGSEIHPPVGDTVQKWVEMLHCPNKPKPIQSAEGVKALRYGPGKSRSEVVFYTIGGMGHTWPGGRRVLPERIVGKTTDKVKATDVIWEFFRDHPRKW
jgi:polyhydroxybutyrate depolymerase